MRLKLVVTVLLLCSLRVQNPNVFAIVGARVFDGTSKTPRVATVLVNQDRIESIGPDIAIPSGTRVVHAEGMTLLPGLFDLHTHLSASGLPEGGPSDWGKVLKAYLYCGITSVVDLGAYPEAFQPMRGLLQSGALIGPRVSLAARISSPGGHGTEGEHSDLFTQEVTTPEEGRAAIRRLDRYRPDVIKVFTDGWRYEVGPDMTSMDEDTLAAIVEESHRRGWKVLAHAVTAAKAAEAAHAGVDVLAHGIGNEAASEELLRLLRETGTYYVGTLAVYESRARVADSELLPAVLGPTVCWGLRRTRLLSLPSLARTERWANLLTNTDLMRTAGVRLGVGSDAGMPQTYHGWSTLHELALMVAGGLTPLEALTAATSGSARALGVENERGRIAPGYLADMVLVNGRPDEDISQIENISTVFLGGAKIDRERLARNIAASGPSPLPAIAAKQQIEDFEKEKSDSHVSTEVIGRPYHDAKMLLVRTPRSSRGHALALMGLMSDKDWPLVQLSIPLSRGTVQPVDARRFRGVRFDARGDGGYTLGIPARTGFFSAPFEAAANWHTVSVPFNELRGRSEWRGDDLLMVRFQVPRPPGTPVWLEIDNVRFYR